MHTLLPLSHFNSTIVRLKETEEMKKESKMYNFNSTIVRLKATTVLPFSTY